MKNPKPITVGTKAVIFGRVSTDEQARDAFGLESQRQLCHEFCEERHWEVVAEFEDVGVSGYKPVERVGFDNAIKFLHKNPDCNLVFSDYSRFGRKTSPALQTLEDLDARGIFSIAASNPEIDSRTAAGRNARRLELCGAENFSDSHSEKTTERMRIAFLSGRWCRRSPIGYSSRGMKVKGQANLVPFKAEADFVIKSFELIQKGLDRPAEVLRQMTIAGLQSKRGKALTLSSFLDMLKNPVYAGFMKSSKWGTVPGLHEPLITERVFNDVQLILKGKKPTAAPYERNRPDFPLRRFLHCSECGTPLTGGYSTSATGKKYGYYNCFKCRAVKSLPPEKAEGEFLDLLAGVSFSATFTQDYLEVLKKAWTDRTGDTSVVLRKLETELRAKQEARRNLVDMYVRRDPNILGDYAETKRRYDDDIALQESKIADAEMQKATFSELKEFSRYFTVDIANAWYRADLGHRQRVQNLLFPSGLQYHPKTGISNSDNECLFNQLRDFLGGDFCLVHPARFELAT